MAICNDPDAIVAVAVAAHNDQSRRHRIMLGKWVSGLEPELGYDAIYAPGHARSTVHWNGLRGAYSFRQAGIFKSGHVRALKTSPGEGGLS